MIAQDTQHAAPAAPAAQASWRIAPSGDRCLIVEFGTVADIAINRQACAAAVRIAAAALPGVTDIVPALTTVGVHYQPIAVARVTGTSAPFEALSAMIGELVREGLSSNAGAPLVIDIPVCYGGEHGPDLDDVAATCGLSPEQVIALHGAEPVDVLMLGFAPGHPYVGRFDARLSPPRRSTPRTAVAAGSIGLANRQTVIYPMTLPGGWNLIGRTPVALFDPHRASPCLLAAGDRVRFVPISSDVFESMLADTGVQP
ncbi:5-oxoprolinase subunit PxpB [Cupriavidus sp. UME77]|uniref:5-oxoprolinase subunit PxpB n=1 Tax=Cupriavidus sp. UME77 TaxID=1862321 RepID=UPI0016044250|nr:5-oxoprolinase subunit PxpB [Cupriavidus sp. UME77]MBB1629515.1 allophanate hydrolase [Cupriavidus sp. UME77]